MQEIVYSVQNKKRYKGGGRGFVLSKSPSSSFYRVSYTSINNQGSFACPCIECQWAVLLLQAQ